MDTITHALAPVIIARLISRDEGWPKRKDYLLIGLAGALPDLLNPHLSLESRMASWSHGIPFWAAFTIALALVSLVKKRWIPASSAISMSLAYVFHLFCDAISGGVNWLHPFGKFVWGDYFVDPVYWVPLDIVLVLTAYVLFRLIPLRKKIRKPSQSEDLTI